MSSVALDGLSVFASGSLINSAKKRTAPVHQAGAALDAATGLVYKIDAFKFSLIDKLVGQQYSDTG
jgi:hypothetical protein